MKIGVSSYSFHKLIKAGETYFNICDLAKEIGFDAIEFIDLDLKNGSGQQTIEELAADLRAHCEKIQLPIAAYTVGADFLNGRGGSAEDEPERIKKCVDVACLLGAKVLRHDAFWAMNGIRDWQEAVAKVAPAIREVAEYAQGKGVKTCSENHGMIMQDAQRMEYMIRQVNHANYGWLVDMGNFMCADENPQYAMGVAAPYAVHVHAKDFIFKSGSATKPEGSWLTTRGGNYIRGTVVGDGVVPIKACVQILKRAGYEGYVSVEFEGAEETVEALTNGLHYLRKLDV